MTKQSFLEYCLNTYGTSPDYPFDDWMESAVLRHTDDRKWYAIAMRVSRRKFGFDSDEVIDVVNLKLPLEMFGCLGAAVSPRIVAPLCRIARRIISSVMPSTPSKPSLPACALRFSFPLTCGT